MCNLTFLYFLLFHACFVSCDFSNFTSADGKQIDDINKYCENRVCVAKCCAKDKILGYGNRCVPVAQFVKRPIVYDKSLLKVYSWNYISRTIQNTTKNAIDTFSIVYSKKYLDDNKYLMLTPTEADYYIIEDGSIKTAWPNHYTRYTSIKPLVFCIELKVEYKTNKQLVMYRLPFDSGVTTRAEYWIIAILMLISCVCLVAVLVVYILLPNLRNLPGIILMALVCSLTTAYFFKAVMLFIRFKQDAMDVITCRTLSIPFYYALMSSFFWMNVTSFDLFWTFRAIRKCRKVNRRGILNKFGWYSLYAYGAPLVLTVGAVVVDMSDVHPDVVKPFFNECLNNAKDTFYYISLPLAILVAVDWLWFLMTAYNIWMAKKELKTNSDSKNTKKNQNRFAMYFKLSALMGINFILELMDVIFEMPSWTSMILTTYDMLIGVAVFFLFVFKKSILIKLCKKYHIKLGFVENMEVSQYTKTEATKVQGSTKSNGYESRNSRQSTGADQPFVNGTSGSEKRSRLCSTVELQTINEDISERDKTLTKTNSEIKPIVETKIDYEEQK